MLYDVVFYFKDLQKKGENKFLIKKEKFKTNYKIYF